MNIIDLTQIIKNNRHSEEKMLKKALKCQGYIDCAKDKEMRRINLCDIAKGCTAHTEVFPIKNGKFEIFVDICTNVKGYEDHEFIIININKVYKDKDLSFPYKIFTYAKAVK